MKSDPDQRLILEKYLQEEFEWWTMRPVFKFYMVSYNQIKERYYWSYFSDLADFKDVFQRAMESFCVAIQDRKYHFNTNGHAFWTLDQIFYHKMVDFFREQKASRKRLEQYKKDQLSEEDTSPLVAVTSSRIQELFCEMDKIIGRNQHLLSPRQKQFYNSYKKAILTLNDEKEIKLSVIKEMGINESYFGKLKTEVIHIIKKSIDGSDFF
jgi:hypothetical protein